MATMTIVGTERVTSSPLSRHVNLSGTGTKHVGALGMSALCLLAAAVSPGVVWLAAVGVAGGIVLGVARIALRPKSRPPVTHLIA